MPDRSIKRLTHEDIRADPTLIERLVNANESLFVERKQSVPREGIGPTIASFANTLGGWLILGVDNAGALVGFSPPGNADLADWVRECLRNEVDPLPPFVAGTAIHEGHEVGLIKVAESTDTPHVTASGAVYVRVPAGKQPVTDHSALLELARRGREADASARERLTILPLIQGAFGAIGRLPGEKTHPPRPVAVEWIVRVAPVSIPAGFADRALSQATARWAEEKCAGLVLSASHPWAPKVIPEPRARGIVVRAESQVAPEIADVVIDAGGVIAARKARRRNESVPELMHLPGLADDYFHPLLDLAAEGLSHLDANGRAVLSLEVRGVEKMAIWIQDGIQGPLRGQDLHLGGELGIPADEADLRSVSDAWMREIGRSAGIAMWEPPSAV
jgi:hypothetical protein